MLPCQVYSATKKNEQLVQPWTVLYWHSGQARHRVDPIQQLYLPGYMHIRQIPKVKRERHVQTYHVPLKFT